MRVFCVGVLAALVALATASVELAQTEELSAGNNKITSGVVHRGKVYMALDSFESGSNEQRPSKIIEASVGSLSVSREIELEITATLSTAIVDTRTDTLYFGVAGRRSPDPRSIPAVVVVDVSEDKFAVTAYVVEPRTASQAPLLGAQYTDGAIVDNKIYFVTSEAPVDGLSVNAPLVVIFALQNEPTLIHFNSQRGEGSDGGYICALHSGEPEDKFLWLVSDGTARPDRIGSVIQFDTGDNARLEEHDVSYSPNACARSSRYIFISSVGAAGQANQLVRFEFDAPEDLLIVDIGTDDAVVAIAAVESQGTIVVITESGIASERRISDLDETSTATLGSIGAPVFATDPTSGSFIVGTADAPAQILKLRVLPFTLILGFVAGTLSVAGICTFYVTRVLPKYRATREERMWKKIEKKKEKQAKKEAAKEDKKNAVLGKEKNAAKEAAKMLKAKSSGPLPPGYDPSAPGGKSGSTNRATVAMNRSTVAITGSGAGAGGRKSAAGASAAGSAGRRTTEGGGRRPTDGGKGGRSASAGRPQRPSTAAAGGGSKPKVQVAPPPSKPKPPALSSPARVLKKAGNGSPIWGKVFMASENDEIVLYGEDKVTPAGILRVEAVSNMVLEKTGTHSDEQHTLKVQKTDGTVTYAFDDAATAKKWHDLIDKATKKHAGLRYSAATPDMKAAAKAATSAAAGGGKGPRRPSKGRRPSNAPPGS